jgi:hypothetical protein
MTRFTSRSDITRLMHSLIAETAWWLTHPHHFADALALLNDQHPAHPKAQNLDPTRGTVNEIGRPTENAALNPDPVAAEARQLLDDFAYVDRMIGRWGNMRRHFETTKRPMQLKAGHGTCPKSSCRTCWEYGTAEPVDDRVAGARDCRWCGSELFLSTVADYRRLEPDIARRLVAEVPA